MKRSAELAPLSREHHIALVKALRLRRATEDNLSETVAEYLQFVADDSDPHFDEEEAVLVPIMPEPLARRMVDEHAELRRLTHALETQPDVDTAHRAGELLTAHVRFEERQVFDLLERTLAPAELAEIGRRLSDH